MRKTLLFIALWLVTIGLFAQSWPATLPNLGNGRLKVVSQNCEYYYTESYATTEAPVDYTSESGMLEKTRKLAQSLVYMDADIYAFCEIETNDTTLGYLAAAMNRLKGSNVYMGMKDGLTNSGQWCKNGYLYRKDRVAPEGPNTAGTNQSTVYKYRMRIQAFKELATNEVFVLSTNHFKSKSGDVDGNTQTTRNANAQNLLTKLAAISIDPDILIVGDLNETTTEPAVSMLVDAGYEEQLERFDANAYSYYYRGNQLIDHILANESMAEQVTGAGAFHINTNSYRDPNKTNFRYSDHDPVMVALNLGGEINPGPGPTPGPDPQPEDLNNISKTPSARMLFVDGKFYILREGEFYTLDGKKLK